MHFNKYCNYNKLEINVSVFSYYNNHILYDFYVVSIHWSSLCYRTED